MKEKIKSLIKMSPGILSLGIIILIFIRRLLPVFLPFLISFVAVSLTSPLAERLSASIKAPLRVVRLLLSLFFLLLIGLFAAVLVWQGISSLLDLLSRFREGNRFFDLVNSLSLSTTPLAGILPDNLSTKAADALELLLSNLISSTAGLIATLVGRLPQYFLFILVCLISLVYFSLDLERIEGFFASILSSQAMQVYEKLRSGLLLALKKYLFSYSLILLITYSLLFLGFLILGVEGSATLAFFVAILDILPVIGVGTVLIPWSIIAFLMSDTSLGIGLIVLFLVNAVIRQLIEPKILGKSLDLHPLLTLMLIYVGFSLFGIWGLILLPLLAVSILFGLKNKGSAKID